MKKTYYRTLSKKQVKKKHFALNANRHGRLSHFTYYAMLVLAIVLTAVTTSMPAAAAGKASRGKDYVPADYTWTTQSKNSSESMPCGGHDVGMNVWVENGDVMIYVARSGMFDENNTLLKAGRLRLHLTPNPFNGADAGFSQTLKLDDGAVYIKGKDTEIRLWADVETSAVLQR